MYIFTSDYLTEFIQKKKKENEEKERKTKT